MEREVSKKEKRNAIIVFSVLILGLAGIAFLWEFIFSEHPSYKLKKGESEEPEFCIKKCGENKYFDSYNNSEYSYIIYECIEEKTKTIGGAKFKTKLYYFDSDSLEKITEKEIVKRIE